MHNTPHSEESKKKMSMRTREQLQQLIAEYRQHTCSYDEHEDGCPVCNDIDSLEHELSLIPLPRGHAYIRMRNRGYKIDIDYPELDSAQAERIIKAAMAIVRNEAFDDKIREDAHA